MDTKNKRAVKTMIVSGAAFLLIFGLVVGNSLFICGTIRATVREVEESHTRKEYEDAYAAFQKKEKLISLTVSHEDLTNVENAFAELIAVSDDGDAGQLKSRLRDSLEHLRRLSELSTDSIF